MIVGGGLRKEEEQLELFESIVNMVRSHAPQALIAFNGTPDDLADAVARVRRRPHGNTGGPERTGRGRSWAWKPIDRRAQWQRSDRAKSDSTAPSHALLSKRAATRTVRAGPRCSRPTLGCDVGQRLVEDPLVPELIVDGGLPLAVLPVVGLVDQPASRATAVSTTLATSATFSITW